MPNTFTISKRNLYIIGTGIILILAILIFMILKPSSNGISNSISGLQTNSSLNSNNTGSSISAEKIVIPENYPQILVKRKTNPSITANLLVKDNKKVSVYLRDSNTLIDQIELTMAQKVGSPTGIKSIANQYILSDSKSDGNTSLVDPDKNYTGVSELVNPLGEYKGQFMLKSFRASNDSFENQIQKKVIWFYSPVDPNKVNWQEEYKKNNDPNHASYTDRGVFIYTRNFNNIQGTFIQDLEKKLDFKIYDKPCEWVSFINNDFICQTTQHQLVNLTTKQTFGGMGEIVEVVEDNDNNIYYRNDLNQVFKANLSNVGSPTKIFELPKTLPISKITWTNQNELFLNINQEQSDEYKAKVNEVNKTSYTVEKQNIDFPKSKTIELKQDGTTVERPEFKDYVVLQ